MRQHAPNISDSYNLTSRDVSGASAITSDLTSNSKSRPHILCQKGKLVRSLGIVRKTRYMMSVSGCLAPMKTIRNTNSPSELVLRGCIFQLWRTMLAVLRLRFSPRRIH